MPDLLGQPAPGEVCMTFVNRATMSRFVALSGAGICFVSIAA